MTLPSGALVSFSDERDDKESMLVGGIYLPRARLMALDEAVSDVKEAYDIPDNVPVKWNLRDPVCARAKQAIGNRVDEFRKALFKRLRSLDVNLLMSLVWKGDPSYRVESWKWSFENILQRLCIILDRKKSEVKSKHDYPFLDVVFDWLPGSTAIDEYFEVYSQAYHDGYQFIRNKLPALKSSDACPCLLVSSVKYSPALQATDMVLGAVGDFFTWVFKHEREQSVRNHFVSLYDMFHRADAGTVIGMGLVVKKSTRAKVCKALEKLGLEP